MWYGKIAIILFLFSGALQFSMYFVNTVFANTAIDNNYSYTIVSGFSANYSQISHFTGGRDPNPLLYFGDFLIGLTVLFNILTGASIITILNSLPGFGIPMQLLVQILYGTSSAVLWVYVVANRSI